MAKMGRARLLFLACGSVLLAQLGVADPNVKQWSTYEIALGNGPQQTTSTNPFDVEVFATFTHANGPPVRVRGFYDGDGVYRVRFMPSLSGPWAYTTSSSASELEGKSGTFVVDQATKIGQSPVRVKNTRSFEFADGSQHFSVGTTSYAWIHQNDSLISDTVKTLSAPGSPFNKMRMTVFPKWYSFNHWNPEYYPYEGALDKGWDFKTFNVSFWKRLDERILSLQRIGVQADIILFHPYDNARHWGFACMGGTNADTYDTANDERYLHYIVARLGAYHNIWWSMANEWDLVKCKSKGLPASSPVWDRLFQVLAMEDVHGHLTSIHNCVKLYNHSRPWITHISSQGGYDMGHTKRKYTPKPIVWDEVMYEGNIGSWGGLTAGQMVDRFWWGLSYGIYVGHGETIKQPGFKDDDQVLWWSKGSKLRGESPTRIEWFTSFGLGHFDKVTCACSGWGDSLCDDSCLNSYTMGDGVNLVTDEETFYFLHSSAYNQPAHRPADSTLNLPPGEWELRPVDFWSMEVLPPTAIVRGGGASKLAGSALTFPDLINNSTLAPCGRSSSGCCSNDKAACTPFLAMLVKKGDDILVV